MSLPPEFIRTIPRRVHSNDRRAASRQRLIRTGYVHIGSNALSATLQKRPRLQELLADLHERVGCWGATEFLQSIYVIRALHARPGGILQ